MWQMAFIYTHVLYVVYVLRIYASIRPENVRLGNLEKGDRKSRKISAGHADWFIGSPIPSQNGRSTLRQAACFLRTLCENVPIAGSGTVTSGARVGLTTGSKQTKPREKMPPGTSAQKALPEVRGQGPLLENRQP
jgi:hypothetical protein